MSAAADQVHLSGRVVLILEDEYLIAQDLARIFEQWGTRIVGPAGNIAAGLALLEATEHIDFAVLDVNLHGEMSYPVIDALQARGVSLVLVTGYDSSMLPSRYASLPRCEKPVDPKTILRTLMQGARTAALQDGWPEATI